MPAAASSSPVTLVSEWSHLFLVVLDGDLEAPDDEDFVAMALEAADSSGKQPVIDLTRVPFLDCAVLNVLIDPVYRQAALPWLVGPLSPSVRRLLDVTGLTEHFRSGESGPQRRTSGPVGTLQRCRTVAAVPRERAPRPAPSIPHTGRPHCRRLAFAWSGVCMGQA
ncbi:STAS domain-containing protein [Streptomyces collinus]